jgi:hypothetical protein
MTGRRYLQDLKNLGAKAKDIAASRRPRICPLVSCRT